MNKFFLIVFFIGSYFLVNGQKYFTKTGTVSFFSKTSMENIEAVSKTANCVLDVPTGAVEMAVLVKSFNFEKALMQEHFNENYMESTKFPKANFKGSITNMSDITLTKDGNYKATAKGSLTLHGVTKPLETPVSIQVVGGKVTVETEFNITVADYNISIPSLVKDNVAKVIKVNVKTGLEEFKKAQ